MEKALLYTVDDYRAMPEGGPRYQLVEGELIMMSPGPKMIHQLISADIGSLLVIHVKKSGLGKVFMAPFDVVLSDIDVVQPDIMFISNANRHRIKDAGVEGAPDLVVEILSASNRELDRGPKLKLYARSGVEELWIVDPDHNTLEIYHLKTNPEQPVITLEKNGIVESALLPGFSLDIKEIFPDN